MSDNFTFEALCRPDVLLAQLRGRLRPETEAEPKAPKGSLRRGMVILGLTFVSMFALPVLLEFVQVPIFGLIAALLVFVGFGYGAFEVYRGMSLSGFGARFNAPDTARLEVAEQVVAALAPDLQDAESMLIVLMDSVRTAVVKERTKKPSGAWVEVRAQEWLHFHGRSEDGARWTLRAVLTERAKIKMKARGSKTRLQHAEHIEVTRQGPVDQPMSAETASRLRRLTEGKRALGPDLKVQAGRCQARKLTLKVALSPQRRAQRLSTGQQTRVLGAGAFLGTQAQVDAQDILLAANMVARLAQGAHRG